MAGLGTKIKQGIGRFFSDVGSVGVPPPLTINKIHSPQASPAAPPNAPIEGEATIIHDLKQPYTSFAEMTPEDIQTRNYAILSEISFDPPAHRVFMDKLKSIWRIVGPIAFVVFTAWEVYYFMWHFMPKDESLASQVLLWGITLIIEIPLMIATYDQATRKERKAEAQETGRTYHEPDGTASRVAWGFLALVNVAGQISFLVFITKAGGDPWHNPATLMMYGFIAIRVTGVIIGDVYTAFFLSPEESSVARVLRRQKAQADGLKQLTESSGERQRIESQSKLELKRNQRAIKREDDDAVFIERINEENRTNMLLLQKQFMLGERSSPPSSDEPETGEL